LKTVKTITYWIFIICIPILLLTSTVRAGVSSTQLYQYGFHEYQASQVTGLDETQLKEIADNLINYFNSRVETPQITVVKEGQEFELFHDYELAHLRDVKGLFQIDYLVQTASLVYIIIYTLLFLLWRKGRWQDLAKGVRWGCVLTLCFIIVVGIVSFIDFQQLFIGFHYLFFGNPSQSPWILDPSKDYLIMLFPEPFWQDIAIFGGIAIATEALFLGGIAWLIPFIYRRRRRSRA
jgi:integral membrane protein (TIGR01906 family)